MRRLILVMGALGLTLPGCAQSGLEMKTSIAPIYPPIARAAHVSGKVVIEFGIDTDGTVRDVHVVSGPEMLKSSATDAVKKLEFKLPLPVNVERMYRAEYSYGTDVDAEDLTDHMDGPQWEPGGGCIVILPETAYAIHGEIRGESGALIAKTDVAPGVGGQKCAAPPKNDQSESSRVEFIQLDQDFCDAYLCGRFSLRVERNGQFTFTPLQKLKNHALWSGAMRSADTDALFERFDRDSTWTLCAEKDPLPQSDGLEYGSRLQVSAGGRRSMIDPVMTDEGERLVWALLKATGGVEWMRGDLVREPMGKHSV